MIISTLIPQSIILKFTFRPPNPPTYTFEFQDNHYVFYPIVQGVKKQICNFHLFVHAYLLKGNELYVPMIHLTSQKKSRTVSFNYNQRENLYDSKSFHIEEEKPTIRDKKVVIFSHANASDLGDVYFYGERIVQEYGVDFIGYDYTGYGIGVNQYKPNEYQTYEDLQSVIAFAVQKLNYQLNQIILWGFSLGTGVAVELATRFQGIGSLILQAPLASIYNWFGNKDYGKKDLYVNIKKIGSIKIPILLIHGNNDKIINIQQCDRLYEKVNKQKVWYCKIHDVGHNDLQFYIEDGQSELGLKIHKFLKFNNQNYIEKEYKLLQLCYIKDYKPGQHYHQYNLYRKPNIISNNNCNNKSKFCLCD